MTQKTNLLIAALCLFLAACSGNQPNHIGNPLLLPISGIGNTISNGTYNARRGRVSDFVVANYAAISQQIPAGQHHLIDQAMDIAGVKGASRQALFNEVHSNQQLYLSNDPEKLVVALMVHGP